MKKGNVGLLALVNETIAAMRADGSLDALVATNNLAPVDLGRGGRYDTLWVEAAEALAAATPTPAP